MLTKSKYTITGVKDSRLLEIIGTFNAALEQQAGSSYAAQDYRMPSEMGYNLNILALMFANDIFLQRKQVSAVSSVTAVRERYDLPQTEPPQNFEEEGRDWVEQEVNIWEDDSDPVETVTLGGTPLKLRRSEQEEVAYKTAVRAVECVNERKFIFDKREYLRLLSKVQDLKSKPFPLGHPKTEADRRMNEEFKRHLVLHEV